MTEIVSLRRITKFGCPIPMVSIAKNTYKQHYMDKHVIFRNIYVHALTILEERGHEFKGQWGRVYWRD